VEEPGEETANKPPPNFLPAFENVQIAFLSGNLLEVLKKKKYEGLFDQAYFGNMAVVPLFEEAGILHSSSETKREKDAFGSVMSTAERLASQETAGATAGAKPAPETADAGSHGAGSSSSGAEKSESKSKESLLSRSLKPECQITVESMKYQVHFEGRMKLGFRQRVNEALEKLEFDPAGDFAKAVGPKLAPDMKDLQARELEKDAPDFLVFRRRRECEKLD